MNFIGLIIHLYLVPQSSFKILFKNKFFSPTTNRKRAASGLSLKVVKKDLTRRIQIRMLGNNSNKVKVMMRRLNPLFLNNSTVGFEIYSTDGVACL